MNRWYLRCLSEWFYSDDDAVALPLCLFARHHGSPERDQSCTRQFEVRYSERDADDRDRKDQRPEQVAESKPYACEHDPDDVPDGVHAAALPWNLDHDPSERPQGIPSKLERLDTERDRDDEHEHDDACYCVAQSHDQTAEDEPEDVAERSHKRKGTDVGQCSIGAVPTGLRCELIDMNI